MSRGIPTPKEIKELIISRILAGEKVDEIANEFNLYPNTIRKWLGQEGLKLNHSNSVSKTRSEGLEISRLKRQNQDLLAIIGELTVINKELSKKKSSKKLNY